MFPLIAIASGLAELAGSMAPTIAGWLGGSKAADVATKVVDVAKTVTGTADGATALAMLQTNPDKAIEFQTAIFTNAQEMAKIAQAPLMAEIAAGVSDLEQVNTTIRAEVTNAAVEAWYQKGWRPYIGFSLGFYINSLWILPMFKVQPVILSPDLVIVIGAILGVASWQRSMNKLVPATPK